MRANPIWHEVIHVPARPWRARDCDNADSGDGAKRYIWGADGTLVAKVDSEVVAAFIVRLVNANKALTESLLDISELAKNAVQVSRKDLYE